jgi:hypothetical protein
VSTVAPQALFMLNHPFVVEQAKHAAGRLLAEPAADARGGVARAYRLALGRSPTGAEVELALRFLSEAGNGSEAWAGLVHALFASMEFRYVD